MAQSNSKKCQRCNQDKKLSEYYKNITKTDDYNGICKVCQKEVDALNKK